MSLFHWWMSSKIHILCTRCDKVINKDVMITLHHIDGANDFYHPKCMEKIEAKERKMLRKRGEVHVLPNQGG